ncbi:cytochrome P450 4B1-like [Ptychodera flava]|uniref:cytochrome P450 4B1-like n=1 Tax=Ptychodera flava TaxID=63121 RepID=UPI00396A77A8
MMKNSGRYGLKTDDLVDHVRTFMLAGHETTSASLMWTLYSLACYPDVQKKAREEINSMLSEDDIITAKAVENMPYLNGVVKEGLRLHAPIPGVSKRCVKEDIIRGVRIPVGTLMGISIVGLHKNPKLWPDPEKFDPSRFMPPNSNSLNPWQFLPFSSGKHTCIGYRLSLMESKITLATLLRHLEFSLVPGFTFKKYTSLSVKALPSMMLRVRNL